MSIITAIVKALFGATGPTGPDYGAFDPNDFARYHQASDEISDADGDESKLQAIYAKYGLRDEDAWGRVAQAFHEANRGNPDFYVVAINNRVREQLEHMRQHYAFPMEYLAPVEGVGMDRLAAIVARREAAASPAAVELVLANYGMDDARYRRIEAAWHARMGGTADAMAAGIISGFWHTYVSVARSAMQKAA